jgi:hypothetical protein
LQTFSQPNQFACNNLNPTNPSCWVSTVALI